MKQKHKHPGDVGRPPEKADKANPEQYRQECTQELDSGEKVNVENVDGGGDGGGSGGGGG